MMIIDTIGWIGSIFVIVAYAMNIYGKLSAESFWYISLNIAGSAALIVNTFYHHAIPSMVVNIVWVGIALVAVFKRSRKEIVN